MTVIPPINLKKWIDEHKDFLKPPVCNKMVFRENGFIVMVVGGPNSRDDFHVNEGAEFFYQLQGEMILKTYQEGKIVDVPIREGDIFLLPPKVPHSPQRFKDSVGLVIERSRTPDEKDGLMWFCEKCNGKLYEEFFKLRNIEIDFPPVFQRFYQNGNHRTCKKCHHVLTDIKG